MSTDRDRKKKTNGDSVKKRHQRMWLLARPLVRAICARHGFTFERVDAPGPYLLISNHATNFLDIIFITAAVGKKAVSFVGSEHILRSGWAGRALNWCAGLIPRPKGAAGITSVREILKTLRSGTSVVLFAEGSASWDGRSVPVVKGTGSLVRASGVPLVTYRLEGGYLTRPRWSSGPRSGPVKGRLVHVYPPEEIKALSSDEINALIDRDIREDAWERQRKEMTHRRGKRQAEYLERLLYLCPRCHKIGTLLSEGDALTCACGAAWRYRDTGFPDPAEPFRDLAEWEDWQKAALRAGDFEREDKKTLFSDEGCALSRIEGHDETALGTGRVIQEEDALICDGHRFALDGIREMDMVRHNILLFTTDDGYFQIRASGRTNMRKYLEIFRQYQDRQS